jgi:clan AA aspartic protease (TIGR02281 family)
VKHLIWAAAVLAAFLLGLYLGPALWEEPQALWERPQALWERPQALWERPQALWEEPQALWEREAGRLGTESAPDREVATADPRQSQSMEPWQRSLPAQLQSRAAGELSESVWHTALDQLDALARSGDHGATAAMQQHLLERIRDRAQAGDPALAGVLLDAYLGRNPHDPDAYLLNADLQQMQGRSLEALSPLLDLLAFADDPEVVARARDKLRLLAGVRETQLLNSGDMAGLLRLFEDLTARDPGFDGHRLRLAHWLLRAGRAAQAERVLAETGTVGVDPESREDLAAEIQLARTGLPFQRRDGAMHVKARLAGQPLELLVDTGATVTAISRAGVAALGARPTGQWVQVQTAGGVIDSEVHRVKDLEIGALRLDSLSVLVLDGPLPRGVDGLLGMDVLRRFPGEPGTGLPAPASH